MKSRKPYVLLFFLTSLFMEVSAQESKTLFYDAYWNLSSEKAATYKRDQLTLSKDSGFYVKIFRLEEQDLFLARESTLLMEGRYSSLNPDVEEGEFHFYKTGPSKRSYIGSYTAGRMTGIWKTFNKAHKLIKTIHYDIDSTYIPSYFSKKASYDTTQPIKYEMPSFGNGWEAMQKHIRTSIEYPPMSLLFGRQGKVIIGFTVEKDGTLTSFKILETAHQDLGSEALRIASAMPKWEPGKMDGKPVAVKMTLPIKFYFK